MGRRNDLDPEGTRLPIKIDTATNCEYTPRPLTRTQRHANRLAHEAASENARRLGMGRRGFLVSAMGACSTLLACNRANPDAGGGFAISEDAAVDPDAAAAAVSGDEFIFDVQTHCVDPSGSWARGRDGEIWARNLSQAFGQASKCADGSYACYSAQTLAQEVYLDSDTDVAVVSALWGTAASNPTPIAYAAEAREVIEAIGGEGARCLIHGGVLPNDPGELEAMDEKAQHYRVDAWKMYPQWGPEGTGFFLDESDFATRMFENARRLGVTTIAVHKGVPLRGLEYGYSSPQDMGRAAAANPDLTFLVYHGGFEPGVTEGAYNDANPQGVDRLIKAHRDAGLPRNGGNLYAEMGSLWRYFMSRPDEAAHIMGKLLATFGEERIMWGTDSIWYGSPQDQIQAFRTFQIGEEYRERHGYPEITPDIRAKIFGLNGARVYGLNPAEFARRDGLAGRRAAYRDDPNPSFATYGPATRREFLTLWDAHGGRPG